MLPEEGREIALQVGQPSGEMQPARGADDARIHQDGGSPLEPKQREAGEFQAGVDPEEKVQPGSSLEATDCTSSRSSTSATRSASLAAVASFTGTVCLGQ